MIRERKRSAFSGLAAVLVLLVLLPVLGRGLVGAARAESLGGVLAWLAGLVLVVISFPGLFVVNPNEGLVLQLFGDYRGTVTTPGLRWANPFYSKRRISQRVRNFESSHLKVNDTDGNPVEIAAAMLRRQQAGAIIAARQKIVEGAVGMVDLALERLSASKLVQLDEERKAAMVSNLLVVLCGDREVQPVVNTGTIYQ